ncbi:DUF397 domain-containing protein [Nocardiopsis trehalosi]|jgi:hypothetical protein|uniref:DUF397 domain-containing protein n=1 Tax=Nocardiopsis trehalosi TaxID=109329 RepID=UPI000A008E8D|nr:DUF397 domain-containing protein [Nocardiopsis trehalosi]
MLSNDWKKSSRSNAGGACVEARSDTAQVWVRDTQNREGATLAVPAREWIALLNDLDHM